MPTVLIADDEPEIRNLCRIVLANEGFQVLEAGSAPECVSLVRRERPDLVLLDWMMPEVSGIDALRVLKSSEITREIPVVMLTALGGTGDICLATHLGADGYVTKPFEIDTLLSLVRRSTAMSAALAA